MEPAVTILLCLFASIGLVQAMGWVLCRLARPKQESRSYHVILLERDPGALEAQLRYEMTNLRWSLSDRCVPLFLVDNGLGEEALAVCRRMLQNTGGVWICGPADLPWLAAHADDLQCPQDGI